MRDDVARAALRAAAGLALTVPLFGCGNVVIEETSSAVRLGSGGSGGSGSSDPGGGGHAAGGGGANVATGGSGPSCLSEACCTELTHTYFGSDPNNQPDPTLAPADVKSCCGVLAAHYDALLSQPGTAGAGGFADPWGWNADGDIKWACCASIEWASTTCTPWGPPMPPAFRRRLRTFARALEVA